VVVPEEGADLSQENIIAQIKSQAANFKVPKRVYIVEALPRNTMGKVQKNTLREQYS